MNNNSNNNSYNSFNSGSIGSYNGLNNNDSNDTYTPVQHETNIKKEKKLHYEYMELLVATPLLALIKFIPNNKLAFRIFSVTLIGAIGHGTYKLAKSFGGQEDKEE